MGHFSHLTDDVLNAMVPPPQGEALKHELRRRVQLETIAQVFALLKETMNMTNPLSSRHPATEDDVQQQLHQMLDVSRNRDSDIHFRHVLYSEFVGLLDAFEQDGVDLARMRSTQRVVALMMRDRETHSFAVRELLGRGQLEPVIPIFYRTDRPIAKYDDRYGFSLRGLLKEFGETGVHRTVLQFGQGSGASMRQLERDSAIRGTCTQYGMCDVLRYQVDALILEVLDREALRRGGADLTEPELRALAMALYKMVVIREGRTHEDDVPYDDDAAAALKADPNALVELLRRRAPLLKDTAVLPDDVGAVDASGRVVHPRKALKPESAAYRHAEELLAEDTDAFLRAGPYKRDVRSMLLPVAYPAGTLLADFRKLGRLKPGQIDVSFGVRSTAYLQGDDFVRFGHALVRSLAPNGIHVCDGIRLNYGHGYQLEEARAVGRDTGFPVRIITGPAPGKEDPRQDHVPLGLVLSEDPAKIAYVRAGLRPGFELTTPDALLDDADYVRSLSRRG